MNRQNLENLTEIMVHIGVDQKMIEVARQSMESNLPSFEIKGQLPSDRGQLDIKLSFNRSTKSENYFFNRYDLALNKVKPLPDGQKYFVTHEQDGKNLIKSFQSPGEAVKHLREQEGAAQLLIGKDFKAAVAIGSKEAGSKSIDIQPAHRSVLASPLTNTFYVNEGKCFKVEQAANLMQGRSVFRDDLVSQGRVYSIWAKIDFERPKDKYDNFELKTYNESYKYDLNETLAQFKIAELDDPKKLEKVIADLKNGNRPVVTVTDATGQVDKLRIQAVPQYRTIDFSDLEGKRMKRESFEKDLKLDNHLSKGQRQEVSEKQGMRI